MKSKKRGFTLIELVIVITVIAILASITVIGMNIYLKDARDSERASKVTIISEALEKYYDEKGEYPSCAAVRDVTPAGAAALLNIDEGVFTMPNAPTPMALYCVASAGTFPSAESDTIYYEDPSVTTSSVTKRPSYELIYYSEGTDSVVRIKSRRGW